MIESEPVATEQIPAAVFVGIHALVYLFLKAGNTVFFSTHILDVAEEICSEIAILHRGDLLYSGTMARFLGEGAHLQDFFVSLIHGGPGA